MAKKKGKVLGDTLADRLGLIEPDTPGDTRADVGAEVLVNTLPERLGQVEFRDSY